MPFPNCVFSLSNKIFALVLFVILPAEIKTYKDMQFNVKEIFTVGMALFAVIDIVGSIPIIIDLRQKVGHIKSEKSSIVAMVLMIAFLFLGESILNLIRIDVSSFAIAGSFVLFILALKMILGINLYRDDIPETASIVPIAFPLIAGVGTLTSLLSLRAEYQVQNIIVAIIFNIIVVYAVLKLSTKIEKILGSGGIFMLLKVFVIKLLAILIK